jgi:hypothetical protein
MLRHYLFGTSNNQLTCTVNNIAEKAGLPIPKGWVFENGSVFKITGLGETSNVKMIHPKVVSNPARFVSLETVNQHFSENLSIPLNEGKIKYVVRHGHGQHNDPDATMEQAHDGKLTKTGIDQAKKSGLAIVDDAGGVLSNLEAYSSDLERTMETVKIIMDQIPIEQRASKCSVCIEARENSRPIGGIHFWEKTDPNREIAIDPFLDVEKLRVLAPDKTIEQLSRMKIENLPKNNPIDEPDKCIRNIEYLQIDWTEYVQKLEKAYAQGKTFGQAASEKLLFDILFEIE